MGVTRTDVHNEADLALAAMAKALAHPARIAIIRCLLASRTCITGDLSEQIGLAQPTVSQHLKELRQAGIIQGSISGTSVNYCINPARWQEIGETFATLFAAFPQTDTCC